MFSAIRLSLSAAGFAAILAGSTMGQMQSYGPLNGFGYPESYTDFSGTTVGMGTDVNDPFGILTVADLPNPVAPMGIPTNFFEEGFYWLGTADAPTAAGNASLIMALEFAFVNGPVAAGDQMTFARLRLRIDVSSAGHYVVTHPYGVDEFDVATPGIKAINFTVDSIAALGATAFDTPLDGNASRIGPTLLKQTNPPAGHLGNPNIPSAITGSPNGTNFFRVEGPNIGGPGINSVETPFFGIYGLEVVPTVLAFTDMGGSLPGAGGLTPLLTGTGDLTPGTPFGIDLSNALPGVPAIFFISPDATLIPFLGGTLIPDPATGDRRNVIVNPAGGKHAGGIVPPALPSGADFYFQYFVLDPSGPLGASASNALKATIK